MVARDQTLSFDTSFAPKIGRPAEIAPGIVRITAPNPGAYTFRGTNSYVVGEGPVFVIDPGPDDSSHLIALRKAIGTRKVEAILLTHTHRDHCGLVKRLVAGTNAPVWFGGQHRQSREPHFLELDPAALESDRRLVPDRVLADGETIKAGDTALEVIATPGHCANHLAFGLAGTDRLFTGDHIMGWNSTLVPVPDGSMADYLHSLEKVIALPYQRYLPGHGGEIEDGPAFARALLAHREQRNSQIVEAVEAGATSIGELQRRIYPALSRPLQRAARMTLKAHAEYLADRGRIRISPGLFGLSLSPRRD